MCAKLQSRILMNSCLNFVYMELVSFQFDKKNLYEINSLNLLKKSK